MSNGSGSASVLMVCLGNICRSPTAEGVFRSRVQAAGLTELIKVDSAGTSSWHIGEPPDGRSIRAAARRRYDLSRQRARQVLESDFEQFDYILAMDRMNLHELNRRCPAHLQHKLGLMLDYGNTGHTEVPDPYDGGNDGFELVLDLLESACDDLLARIRQAREL
jgi:protein-tyrosine phosphatase